MKKIKELRLQQKLSQAQLAKTLNIAQNTLSYWEQGKFEPDSDMLKKLADYFKVSIDYLLGTSDVKKASSMQELITSEQQKRIAHLMSQLTPEEEKQAEEYLHFLLSRHKDS